MDRAMGNNRDYKYYDFMKVGGESRDWNGFMAFTRDNNFYNFMGVQEASTGSNNILANRDFKYYDFMGVGGASAGSSTLKQWSSEKKY
ncbi:hypothetical protein SLA2020_517830 [Shorea laevis]